MLLKLKNNLLPYFAVIVAMTIWGGLPSVTKLALPDISVSLFISIRFIFSSLLLSPLLFRVYKKSSQLSLASWLVFIVTISIMFYSQTWTMHQVPAQLYVVFFSATPLLMALCLKYTMRWPALIGFFIVVLALIAFVNGDDNPNYWTIYTIISVCVSMLSWVVYTVVTQHFQRVYNDLEITAVTCFAAATVSICISLLKADFQYISQVPHRTILCSATIGMILPLAFLGYSYALRTKPIISIFSQYVEPIIGIVIATLLIGGSISLKQGIAFIGVLFGVSLLSMYSSNTKEAKLH